MLITSLKSSAEISAATNPWWVFHPTLDNYVGLLTSNQFLRFFWNSAMVSIFVVTITMLISVPAAFALARMRFWGSATLATGVFLTYLIPRQPAVHSAVQDVCGVRRLDRHPAHQPMVRAADHLSDADGAVLHLDHDRLLRLDPEGARRGRHHRRRILVPDADADLHSGGAARASSPRPSSPSRSPGRSSSIRWCSRPRPTSSCCRSASSPR